MGPRWKGKEFANIALANPISKILTRLQTFLAHCEVSANLSGCNVIIEASPELASLLKKTCFGQPILTSEKEKNWFQLGPEEAFYLCHVLKCLNVFGEDGQPKSTVELWEHMKSKRDEFPYLYKAYSHLRSKNWIVRSGLQYGVDYVAYRHHPSLVHSEFSVVVIVEGDLIHARLKVWSDWQCLVRVSGGVAKSVLVLTVKRNDCDTTSLSCLEQFGVEEHALTRWVPEQSRQDNTNREIKKGETSS